MSIRDVATVVNYRRR